MPLLETWIQITTFPTDLTWTTVTYCSTLMCSERRWCSSSSEKGCFPLLLVFCAMAGGTFFSFAGSMRWKEQGLAKGFFPTYPTTISRAREIEQRFESFEGYVHCARTTSDHSGSHFQLTACLWNCNVSVLHYLTSISLTTSVVWTWEGQAGRPLTFFPAHGTVVHWRKLGILDRRRQNKSCVSLIQQH